MSVRQTDRQTGMRDIDIPGLMIYLLALPFHNLTGFHLLVGCAPRTALVAAGATVAHNWLEPKSLILSSQRTDSILDVFGRLENS